MGGGLGSRCAGRVYGADGVVAPIQLQIIPFAHCPSGPSDYFKSPPFHLQELVDSASETLRDF